nr:CotH kinase family protein [Akkermansiaceae bacterium]
LPEIEAVTGVVIGPQVYFSTPTPDAANGAGTAGPVIFDPLPADPGVPRPTGNASSPPLAVSVKVMKTQYNLSAVRVYYRIMFNPEPAPLLMLDNGTGPDLVAGDGIHTANIPTSAVGAAQMLRWRFEATDVNGNPTRLPAYLSTTDSPQYFGTVAQSALAANSQLPVMEWFVEGAPATGPTAAAFRGCLYYLGRFYDNIGHQIHGQSTAGFAKKSYDFDSNSGFRFVWQEGAAKVKDLNLMSNYADKTKTRNTLSHEVGMMMGAPYHFCHPVRIHLNGAFHGVMDLMEDGDDRMLERNGLDPEGALYKIYAETMNVSAEKKTRKTEPNTDLNTFTTALDPGIALTTRRTWGYDNIDIAATVNYLVLRQLNSDADHGHKNYYLYRDTNRTGEWLPIAWDVDLSQGHQWNGNTGTGGYFNDTLITNNPLNRHSANNRLYNLILESPEFQQMFARRMRTAMDTLMQPPGTTNGWFETRMRAIAASVDPDPANPSPLTDGDLDRAKWGMHAAFIDNKPREEVERVVSGYYAPRRAFLFDQSATRPLVQRPGLSGGTAIPDGPQNAGPGSVVVHALDYYPDNNSQAAEFIILRNTTAQAIDLTGWRLAGAVEHRFTAGTVIPSGAGTAAVEYRGLLHVVKDAVAFRARTTGPRGGEKRFIQGNYSGQLSSRGETVRLYDQNDALITSFTYPGNPTAAQQFLRISEIHYHPAQPSPEERAQIAGLNNDDFEFIELVNNGPAAIDLTGYRFTAGIGFTFPASSIPPGGRVVVARRPEAFLLRHPGFPGLLGPYDGALANDGERIELTEASGEVVADFSYDDAWRPVTDGGGYSLVLRQAATAADAMGSPESWLMSPQFDGSPGTGDEFATISLAQLAAVYTGSGIGVAVVTTPAGLPVDITYDGSATLPVDAGAYAVSATIIAPSYEGTATGTLVIAKASQTITFHFRGSCGYSARWRRV